MKAKRYQIKYYACAGTNPIYELLVTREGTCPKDMEQVSAVPTGRTFKTTEEACEAMVERNCKGDLTGSLIK